MILNKSFQDPCDSYILATATKFLCLIIKTKHAIETRKENKCALFLSVLLFAPESKVSRQFTTRNILHQINQWTYRRIGQLITKINGSWARSILCVTHRILMSSSWLLRICNFCTNYRIICSWTINGTISYC